MTQKIIVSTFAIFLIFGIAVSAQDPQPQDPMREHFFPPELVMRHQQDIQLTPAQRETMMLAMEDAQKQFNRHQWNLQTEMQALQGLLSQNTVDEKKALEQLEKVLDLERQVKRTQISLMIKIKNDLTDAQKEKLTALRK